MEQKKIQRIIGILVVIALVAIVMPLLFGKNDFPVQEAANIKAPPFPDQQQTTDTTVASDSSSTETQVTAAVSPVDTTQDSMQQNNLPVSSANQTTVAATTNTTGAEAKLPEPPALAAVSDEKKAVDAVPSNNKPAPAIGSIIYEPAATTTVVPTTAEASTDASPLIKKAEDQNKPNSTPAKVKPAIVKQKNTHPQLTVVHVKTASVATSKTAWVVQVGNFAVKKNAIHLVNTLRAAGYKAFMHDVKSASGKMNTRVYIGPEFQQVLAAKLSNQIHHHLNLQGFVVSYKPLEV